ncbi:MAG: hypothetical protein AAGJ87_17850, partial [Pseudomonadota bacterium]
MPQRARARRRRAGGAMCAAGALRAVFSYGSNSSAQLAGRLGAPRSPAAAASLPGWERVFVGFSALWGGAVASVARAEGGGARARRTRLHSQTRADA